MGRRAKYQTHEERKRCRAEVQRNRPRRTIYIGKAWSAWKHGMGSKSLSDAEFASILINSYEREQARTRESISRVPRCSRTSTWSDSTNDLSTSVNNTSNASCIAEQQTVGAPSGHDRGTVEEERIDGVCRAFLSCLDELARLKVPGACAQPGCGKPLQMTRQLAGSNAKFSWTCDGGHLHTQWESLRTMQCEQGHWVLSLSNLFPDEAQQKIDALVESLTTSAAPRKKTPKKTIMPPVESVVIKPEPTLTAWGGLKHCMSAVVKLEPLELPADSWQPAVAVADAASGSDVKPPSPGDDVKTSPTGDGAPCVTHQPLFVVEMMEADETDAPPCGADGTDAAPGGADGTDAPPCGADGTDAAPGGADGTDAPPCGADGTTAAPSGADGTAAAPGGADGTTAAPSGADGTTAAPGGADGTTAAPGGADGTTAAPGGADGEMALVLSVDTQRTGTAETKARGVVTYLLEDARARYAASLAAAAAAASAEQASSDTDSTDSVEGESIMAFYEFEDPKTRKSDPDYDYEEDAQTTSVNERFRLRSEPDMWEDGRCDGDGSQTTGTRLRQTSRGEKRARRWPGEEDSGGETGGANEGDGEQPGPAGEDGGGGGDNQGYSEARTPTLYECYRCEAFETTNLSAWRRHRATVHGTDIVCGACNSTFANGAALALHAAASEACRYRQAQCERCGLTFARISRTHDCTRCVQPARSCVCSWPGCKKVFRNSHTRIVHERIHTDSKPFACHLCAYRGRQRNALNYHMTTTHRLTIEVACRAAGGDGAAAQQAAGSDGTAAQGAAGGDGAAAQGAAGGDGAAAQGAAGGEATQQTIGSSVGAETCRTGGDNGAATATQQTIDSDVSMAAATQQTIDSDVSMAAATQQTIDSDVSLLAGDRDDMMHQLDDDDIVPHQPTDSDVGAAADGPDVTMHQSADR